MLLRQEIYQFYVIHGWLILDKISEKNKEKEVDNGPHDDYKLESAGSKDRAVSF
jgi:hypothetical protein